MKTHVAEDGPERTPVARTDQLELGQIDYDLGKNTFVEVHQRGTS